jgi:hypothetical protein
MSLAAAMFSSEYDSWCTPAPVLDRVRRIDRIGLDPFSNAQSIVGAQREFRLDRGEDALRLDWRGHGLCYVNPPFGDEIGDCMRRVAYFAELGVEIVALVPHRTDTAWYRESVRTVRAKCEWCGRMNFLRGQADRSQMPLFEAPAPLPPVAGETSAPFPTVLLYYGRRRARFARAFEGAGEIWTR